MKIMRSPLKNVQILVMFLGQIKNLICFVQYYIPSASDSAQHVIGALSIFIGQMPGPSLT